MEMTLQLLLVVVSLMTIPHVEAAGNSKSAEQCRATMVQSLLDAPNVKQAVADVEDKLKKLESSNSGSGSGSGSGLATTADACTRGMGDNLKKQYDRYVVVDDKTVGKEVLCDTETLGGGWIVIQRRAVGDVDFYQGWAQYKAGFGDVRGDHWIGNEAIYQLTSKGNYEMRINMRLGTRNVYAQYSSFKIGPESDKYRLSLGTYSGTIGQSNAAAGLSHSNGMMFTTKDSDNDTAPGGRNCAVQYHGAWWYKVCHRSNLNGRWGDKTYPALTGINWYNGKSWVYPWYTEMKIRKVA